MTIEDSVIFLRLQRQHLLNPATEDEYEKMFKYMSPMSTFYWTEPGEPPRMAFRSDFDDYEFCFKKRAVREIVKGRFRTGSIGYVYADDLELYASAYRKDASKLTHAEDEMLALLRYEGPMNIGLIKEYTGMLAKNISPILQKLQEKFLVYEDQVDNDLDRSWYLFESEFPDVDLEKYTRIEEIKKIMLRFAYLNIQFNEDNFKSFYHFSVKDTKQAIAELLTEGLLKSFLSGYILAEDEEVIRNVNGKIPAKVYVLHRNDFLVKTNEYWLKPKYKHNDYDIRYYLLIDGKFNGVVYGYFKFTDVPLEDIITDLPEDISKARKYEIIEALGEVVDLEKCPLKRYNNSFIQ